MNRRRAGRTPGRPPAGAGCSPTPPPRSGSACCRTRRWGWAPWWSPVACGARPTWPRRRWRRCPGSCRAHCSPGSPWPLRSSSSSGCWGSGCCPAPTRCAAGSGGRRGRPNACSTPPARCCSRSTPASSPRCGCGCWVPRWAPTSKRPPWCCSRRSPRSRTAPSSPTTPWSRPTTCTTGGCGSTASGSGGGPSSATPGLRAVATRCPETGSSPSCRWPLPEPSRVRPGSAHRPSGSGAGRWPATWSAPTGPRSGCAWPGRCGRRAGCWPC